MSQRPLTPEEERQASTTRISELVWKVKLLTGEELAEFAKRLETEAPEILKGLRT